MALVKRKTEAEMAAMVQATAAATGGGLPDQKGAVAEVAAEMAAGPAEKPVEKEAPAQTAAVSAVRQAAAFPVVPGGQQLVKLFDGMENFYVPEFGTHPRVKSGSGILVDGDSNSYGRWVVVQVMSFFRRWMVGPMGQQSPENNKLMKASMDKVTFTDPQMAGISVIDYIEDLKRQGHTKAGMSEYLDVVGLLLQSEQPSKAQDSLVVVQLSSQSLRSFEAYRMEVPIRYGLKRITEEQARNANIVRFEATPAKIGTNNFTKIVASLASLAA